MTAAGLMIAAPLLALCAALDEPTARDEGFELLGYTHPIPTVALPFLTAGSSRYLNFSLGFAVAPPDRDWALGLEAGIFHHYSACVGAGCLTSALELAVGPLFHFGERGLTGFFLQPKLHWVVHLGSVPRSYTWILGVDLGYQWRLGSWYLAAVAGAGLGICTECGTNFIYAIPIGPIGPTTTPVASVNVNLLRAGYVW
jgi:hypothetical protein